MTKMKKIFAIFLTAGMTVTAQAQQLPTYLDETKPVEQRIEDALLRMTLDEKIAVIHAQSKFSSPGVKRLGFPDLWTDDGPHGVRPDVLWDEWEQAGQTSLRSPVWLLPGILRWRASMVRTSVRKPSIVARV